MKIINHSSILDSTPVQISNGCYPSRVVLRHLQDNEDTPYVIHHENLEIQGNQLIHRNFYRGSYFFTLAEAKTEFHSLK